MSRIVKTAKVLRNNWKKTVFFTGLASYGSHWGYGKYVEFNVMKEYAEEAVKYGQQKLAPFHPARHVTVILNPVANKKKSKDDYEKYCAPLFHLAGLKVSLVTTEAEGQAKDLMEIMDNTDCVVVAGGDGTVHEVVTGLLRRNDSQMAVKRFPIGIVPCGKINTVAFNLNRNTFNVNDIKAKILGESTMAVIRQVLSDFDVMKIEGEQGRPVYSLGQLNVGQIRHTIGKLDEYWYLGQRMKHYLTFFFQSFRNLAYAWDESKPVEVSFTKPCSGCSKCYQLYTESAESSSTNGENSKQSSGRWWSMFLPRNRPQIQAPDPKVLELERMKNTVNEECDQLHSLTINSKNILIRNRIGNSELQMIVHPSDLAQLQFVQEGIRISKNVEFGGSGEPPFQVVTAKDYHIKLPIVERADEANGGEPASQGINEDVTGKFALFENSQQNSPTAIKELDEEEAEPPSESMPVEVAASVRSDGEEEASEHHQWLSIDSESYEYQSTLRISLLPRKVQVYHGR